MWAKKQAKFVLRHFSLRALFALIKHFGCASEILLPPPQSASHSGLQAAANAILVQHPSPTTKLPILADLYAICAFSAFSCQLLYGNYRRVPNWISAPPTVLKSKLLPPTTVGKSVLSSPHNADWYGIQCEAQILHVSSRTRICWL